jgi:hypothetical protein
MLKQLAFAALIVPKKQALLAYLNCPSSAVNFLQIRKPLNINSLRTNIRSVSDFGIVPALMPGTQTGKC